MIISRSIQVAADGITLLFLWLNNIPFCVCTTSSVSIRLFTFRLFRVLAVVNRAVIAAALYSCYEVQTS